MCTLTNAALSSCLVAWLIERSKKPHLVGENVIKSAAISMVRIKCNVVAKKLDNVPLFR